MKGLGFATKCAVTDANSIVLIQFEPNSSVMIPLARESKSVSYDIIDENSSGSLLLKRNRGTQKDLVTLDTKGTFTVVPTTQYKQIPDIDQIANAKSALIARIEKVTGMHPVKDVSVENDNSFMVFETSDGLWIAKLDLKDKPYLLGTGTLPSVRPL